MGGGWLLNAEKDSAIERPSKRALGSLGTCFSLGACKGTEVLVTAILPVQSRADTPQRAKLQVGPGIKHEN